MDMNSYILKRVGIAKAIGLVIGLAGFLMIPSIWPAEGMWLRVGILMWYTTFGAVIGVLGLFDYHPMLKFRMPFWFRGPVFGAWLNLVLAFMMHDKLVVLMPQLEGILAGFKSPFWIVAEGAVIGLLIDAVATTVAGEGIPGPTRKSA
jgi:hypothetical protein